MAEETRIELEMRKIFNLRPRLVWKKNFAAPPMMEALRVHEIQLRRPLRTTPLILDKTKTNREK